MRYLFTIILLFVGAICLAQEPTYNQMRSNYQFRGVRIDSLLLFPKFSDTTTAKNKLGNINGLVIRVGTQFYFRDSAQNKWSSLGGGGGSTDTTSLSNRINSKADTSLLNGVLYASDTSTLVATQSQITSLQNALNGKADSSIDLQQVTTNGNITTNDIYFTNDSDIYLDTFSGILFSNNSRLQEGYIDAGYGGNHGISLICGLGYEYKWEGGRLFVTNSSGNQIREAKYMFNDIPDSSRDYTKGYYVGSRWVLDNGDTYVCTDNSLDAAVWVLQSTQNGRWGNDTALIVLAKVHNSTGTQLNRGEVVMMKGATGDVASVIRANNKSDSTSARTIGMVKDNIPANDTGWVVTQGQISKVNTSAFNPGDVLYLDSINGQVTKVKPQAPYHNVFIGIVERANNGNGLIYLKPTNGYEIDELHDVRITNPINNQILVYSDTQQLWKNRNVYSVVDTVSLSNRINAKLDSSANLQTITENGNGTNLPIQAKWFQWIDTVNTTAGQIVLDNNTYKIEDGDGNIVNELKLQEYNFYDSNGYKFTLNLADIESNQFLKVPDASGTIAILSDLNIKLSTTDTSAMLRNYQRTSSFAVATFGGGSGVAGDTSVFTTSAIYGAFYNDGVDTIILTGYRAIVQGTSASVTPTIYWNDTLSTTVATKAVNSPSAVTSTTTGNNVTSLDNTKIAPGNWVWVQTGTVTTKPTFFSLTLFGYRKR